MRCHNAHPHAATHLYASRIRGSTAGTCYSICVRAIDNPNSIDSVYSYFHTLLTSLKGALASHDNDPEKFFVSSYLDALDELRGAALKWGIEMKDSTFIQLLQKAISGVSVSFIGEPLRGLQIMGVLETRALDFDNIILLSMNERIFPRKHYSRSFIPDSLRRSYGMATTDFRNPYMPTTSTDS